MPNTEGLRPAWKYPSPYSTPDYPLLVAGDRLIGLADSRKIYVVNLFTGFELKTTHPGGGFPYDCPSDQPGPLAFADGAIFFVENDRIKALEVSDGSVRANFVPPTVPNVSALIGFPGLVVAVQNDGSQVSAFRTSDGSLAWPRQPQAPIGSKDTTQAKKSVDLSKYTPGPIAYTEDAMFFVAGNHLIGFNVDFGEQRFPKPGAPAPTWKIYQNQAPLAGKQVVVCSGNNVYGFDRINGNLKWTLDVPATAQTWSCALAGDREWLAAVRADGLVCVASTNTGEVRCQTKIGKGGTATVGGTFILVVTPDSKLQVLRYDAAKKAIMDRGLFALAEADKGEQVAAAGPSIGNGTTFIPTNLGIMAKAYSEEQAAYFPGTTHVAVEPQGTDFHFGVGDFTVEAWVRSSEGGEILCAYPSASDTSSHGFRFNLGANGELQYAAMNNNGSNQDLAKSRPTEAADGTWHHVAVTRKAGLISFYLDGLHLPNATLHVRAGKAVHENGEGLDANGHPILHTLTPVPPPLPCSVDAPKGLSIGACVADGRDLDDHFKGLLREVRVWDIAVDAAAIQSRMVREVPPCEHLKGNWHLDVNEDGTLGVQNDVVAGHRYTATFTGGISVCTDLALDDSAYPYLVHQPDLQWPYSSSWIARGEKPIQGPPAISSDGAVCLRTNNRLYGVAKSNGARLWSMPIAVGCSRPVPLGASFLALTEERGVIRIDSHTGEASEVEGFKHLQGDGKSAGYPAPASDGHYLAAASSMEDGTKIWVLESPEATAPTQRFSTPSPATDLVAEAGMVYTIAGAPGSWRLYAMSATTGQQNSIEVDSPLFCADGNHVFFIHGAKIVLSGSDLLPITAAAPVDVSHITGMSADRDASLLVIATDQGEAVGLSFAALGVVWRQTIAEGKRLNAPLVDGRDVFCTTQSGVAAALDGRNGQLRGLFRTVNAITTPPVEDAGVVYFGCADPDGAAVIDGALHTVVMGETYALRLGITPQDEPGANGYAIVKKDRTKTDLFLREAPNCCIEAWINTASGGEIVSMRADEYTGAGLRLWIDPDPARPRDGILHFTVTSEASGSWQTVAAQAPAHGVLDGRWHHVAVCCQKSTEGTSMRVYVDNEAQTVAAPAPARASLTVGPDGFLAYLGADATRDNAEPANFFRGLIGEVRVWDTYLTAAQICDRMHMKLRGDEADLLAYWNFDTVGVHDGAGDYDGTLSKTGATFWLTDLSFDHFKYPHMDTHAKLVQTGATSWPEDDPRRLSIYELTLAFHNADETPMAGRRVRLWYVRHADVEEPERITIETDAAPTTLTGVRPGEAERPDGASWSATTDHRGEVTVKLSTTDLRRGPSLDVWADFMPANERYHVNTLLHGQKIEKPAPPKLASQSQLLQDYHWSPGAHIDSSRGKATYRTTITSLDADNRPRAFDRIRIYATGHVEIEQAGTPYAITPENGATFQADAEGKLTVVVVATDLKPPSLSVWAGFMNPEARYAINPAEEAQKKLGQVQGSEMKNPDRVTEWRSPTETWRPENERKPQKGPLLSKEQHDHADKIAGAVRHVMAAGLGTSGAPARPPQPARRAMAMNVGAMADEKPAARTAPVRDFSYMRQPAAPALGDRVRSLHTMRHIHRAAPVHPEAIKVLMPEGAHGFVFGDDGNKGVKFDCMMSAADMTAALGTPTARTAAPEDIQFGSGAKKVWNTLKDAAQSGVDGLKWVAVKVGDYVQIAIHKADQIVHMAVRSIVQAIDVVFEFFKNLALLVWQIIQFLLMLFDFSAIIDAHNILRRMLLNISPFFNRVLGEGDLLHDALHQIAQFSTGPQTPIPAGMTGTSPLAIQQVHAPQPNEAMKHSQGVGARTMYSKVQENQSGMTVRGANATAGATPATAPAGDVSEFAMKFLTLAPRLATMEAADAAVSLRELLATLGPETLSAASNSLETGVQGAGRLLTKMLDILNVEIDIPFVSALYKWITGSELTLLSLFCLVLAVVVHVAYLAMVGRKFCDDAADLPNMLEDKPHRRAAAANRSFDLMGASFGQAAGDAALGGADETSQRERRQNPLTWGRADTHPKESAWVAMMTFAVCTDLASDLMFSVKAPAVPFPYPQRDIAKIIRGCCGVISTCIQFVCSTPHLVDVLLDEEQKNPDFELDLGTTGLPARVPDYYRVKTCVLFAAHLIVDLYSLYSGLNGLSKSEEDGVNFATDSMQYAVLKYSCVHQAGLIVYMLVEYAKGPEHRESTRSDLRTACRLFLARDILDILAISPTFIYTYTAAILAPKSRSTYFAASFSRFALRGSALGCHAGAQMKWLGV
jgi:outer membrane protein assembly factor BamB